MPRGAGSLEDLIVEISERVTELFPKFVREHDIKFLEIRCLVLKCAGMRCLDEKGHWK